MLNLACNGDVVFTERVDRMSIGGNKVAVPVAGVFEVRDGKIAAWRDYFDMQQLMSGGGES
jgi:limonene-1,2-epoxide hydrolase